MFRHLSNGIFVAVSLCTVGPRPTQYFGVKFLKSVLVLFNPNARRQNDKARECANEDGVNKGLRETPSPLTRSLWFWPPREAIGALP